MKKHIQFKNSYKIWSPSLMKKLIFRRAGRCKNYTPLIIEWWIHNIAYWLTKSFTFIPAIESLNLRAKDVDLMVDVGVE